ncbi:MAG: transporter substrate-binding domain-containing protein [Chloroflexota bacterium]|nr:transporter substrate-binding domain-containing protein [Chloroflexota bacterium]
MKSIRHLSPILLLLLVALVLSACGSAAEPTPTPTLVLPDETPEAGLPQRGDAWKRIQEAGTMIIGTSVDYPPFEYYDDNYRVDGFDMALIRAIADKLGVEVEIRDIAFAGLLDAVLLEQVDVAIAAIDVTPKREMKVDFSHIYFVSQDAFVSAEDANIGKISDVSNLADYQVGVQRGSVFQDWLEDELIETDLMDPTNLFVYGQIEQGFPDLEAGRVDLLVMDLQPAQVAAEQPGFVVAASGLNSQRYAIAMPKGENSLRTRVNQAMISLKNDGLIVDLAQEYLSVHPDHILPLPSPTPVPPTATPAPEAATPTPRPDCVAGAAYVSDLNYDDHNMQNPPVINPGQPFQKGWRLRNSGTCTWDSSYFMGFDHGNQPGARMAGENTAVKGVVQPGQTYDMYVDLVAPLRPGIYQGFWQMHNDEARAFGERVYVGIRVPSGATPTPAPTQTPTADINFSVDRDHIKQGECVTFSWSVNNVREVYFYADGQNWQNHGVAGQGTSSQCPSQTTTYYLRVVLNDGSVVTRQITIYVESVANAPDIKQFSADPGEIAVGHCTTLRWDVQGNVNRVNISRNNVSLWDGAPFRGSYQDCPPGTGTMNYALEATGTGGTSRATKNVNVVDTPATPTPVPTSEPQPVINAFTVTPSKINVNECVLVAWSTSGGTDHVRLYRAGNVVQDDAGLQGQIQDCLSQLGDVIYTLEASNRVGARVTQDASVLVEPEPVQPTVEPPTPVPPTATAVPPTATPEPPTPTPQPPTAVPPPVITSFSAVPSELAPQTNCTNLSWTYQGSDIAAVWLSRNDQQLAGPDAQSPYQDCLDQSLAGQDMVYQLKVDGEFSGSATQQLVVPFNQGPQPK